MLDQLKLQTPVLVGYSFAGEEMSSVESRFPNRVAGLIYLDGAFRYAFSPIDRGDFQIDTLELRRRLDAVTNAISPGETRAAIDEILRVLPQYEKDLAQQKKDLANAPDMKPTEYAAEKKEHSTPEEGLKMRPCMENADIPQSHAPYSQSLHFRMIEDYHLDQSEMPPTQ